jgi:hypothetical protein
MAGSDGSKTIGPDGPPSMNRAGEDRQGPNRTLNRGEPKISMTE